MSVLVVVVLVVMVVLVLLLVLVLVSPFCLVLRRRPAGSSSGRVVQRQAPVRYSLLDPLAQVRQVPVHGPVGVEPRAGGRGRLAGELFVHQDGAGLEGHLGRGSQGRALLALLLVLQVLQQDLAVLLVHVDQQVQLGFDILHLHTDSRYY